MNLFHVSNLLKKITTAKHDAQKVADNLSKLEDEVNELFKEIKKNKKE
jgi:predicted  nucleic acid-binding Zn-ribbon protein